MVRFALLLMLLSASYANAGGVVLESFAGLRPADSTRLLGPVHDELARRGFNGGDTLAREYEQRVSRPVQSDQGLTPDFETGVDRGHKAWISGRFDEAVDVLTPLVAAAHTNPSAVTKSQGLRDKLLKALIALALSHQRRGDTDEARAVFTELLRSFPDAQVPRSIYGPEANQFFEEVRKAAGRGGRGSLSIKVPDNSVVFINERFDNVGTVTRADLIPGVYRVFVQLGKRQTSRLHYVDVKADGQAVLALDPGFEVAIHTSTEWTGLAFASAEERESQEAEFAVAFAEEMAASAVIVLGIEPVRGRLAVVGSLIDIGTAKEIRRASIALDPAPSDERLRTLARFLAGGDSIVGLDVEVGAPVANEDGHHQTDASTNGRRWMLWVGIGGAVLGAAAGGGLAVKFHGDANDAGESLERACEVSCTRDEVDLYEGRQRDANRNSIIAGIAGGAIVVTGVTLIVLSQLGDRSDHAVAVVPTSDGISASFATDF